MSYDEPDAATGIALLRAHLSGDEETIERLLSLVDERKLFPIVVGQLVRMLHNAGVSEELLGQTLSEWQHDQLP